jgi:hypothetical protein
MHLLVLESFEIRRSKCAFGDSSSWMEKINIKARN